MSARIVNEGSPSSQPKLKVSIIKSPSGLSPVHLPSSPERELRYSFHVSWYPGWIEKIAMNRKRDGFQPTFRGLTMMITTTENLFSEIPESGIMGMELDVFRRNDMFSKDLRKVVDRVCDHVKGHVNAKSWFKRFDETGLIIRLELEQPQIIREDQDEVFVALIKW